MGGIVDILCPKTYYDTLLHTNEENKGLPCDSYAETEGRNN
jgi:hypothetical protein